MEKLTKRQAQILRMIRKFIETEGFPPTRAEIADKLGFRSPNAAEDHLRALQRKGAIELLPGASRGIRLREEKQRVGLPVVGRVAAGSPILAEEHIEAYYNVDARLFQPRAHYFLRVKGMSMRDAGILNGDLLAVHTTREASSGQIVVARVGENEATVRRFRRRGTQVRLQSENPSFSSIEVDLRQQSFTIEGLAVGVLRNNPSK